MRLAHFHRNPMEYSAFGTLSIKTLWNIVRLAYFYVETLWNIMPLSTLLWCVRCVVLMGCVCGGGGGGVCVGWGGGHTLQRCVFTMTVLSCVCVWCCVWSGVCDVWC